jgi:hypothetical protein
MRTTLVHLVATVCLGAALAPPLAARPASDQNPAAAPRVAVCSLVPKDVVKKHLPWENMFDRMPLEEEPIGATGSSCGYPTVHVQVLAYTAGFIEAARKAGPLEAIAGLGDDAWFRNNRDQYAEVFVKVGPRLLTLQADADDGVAAVKPRVIELATVYVATLR